MFHRDTMLNRNCRFLFTFEFQYEFVYLVISRQGGLGRPPGVTRALAQSPGLEGFMLPDSLSSLAPVASTYAAPFNTSIEFIGIRALRGLVGASPLANILQVAQRRLYPKDARLHGSCVFINPCLIFYLLWFLLPSHGSGGSSSAFSLRPATAIQWVRIERILPFALQDFGLSLYFNRTVVPLPRASSAVTAGLWLIGSLCVMFLAAWLRLGRGIHGACNAVASFLGAVRGPAEHNDLFSGYLARRRVGE